MLKKLLLLSFIEGAAVMAAELCGAKLLAPIFGSSLYVWSSVMGITLSALAVGYFLGGWLSQKTDNQAQALFNILSLAGLFILLMPILGHYIIPRISYLPFLLAVVISTITLLFLPVLFLGASSPLFVSLQITQNNGGKVSGTVYAVSTAGGILSTFLCGFYLIPQVGLTVCLVFFGLLLFMINIIVFKLGKFLHIFLLIVVLYLNLQFVLKKAINLYVSDSLLGHMEVQDVVTENGDSVRLLKINNIIQTEMNLETKQSVSDYISLLDSIIPKSHNLKKALVLGLGGGLVANTLVKKNYSCDGVELDARINMAAKKYFYLHHSVEQITADARYFLNHCNQVYDLVMVDIFKAEEQPAHVLTLESLEKLKENLKDSALLVINWHGYAKGSKGLGTSILYNTLAKSGFKVSLHAKSNNENYRNIIFLASLRDFKIASYLLNDKLTYSTLVNTDNLPLLEKYNAEANKTWRTNYLRYYQQKQ
jgi:predicted membrane-bound spermidine synthase